MSSQIDSHTPSNVPQGSQRLPDIPWAENDGSLIWSLITEMEKPENFKVLLGKKDKKENTSGDSKTKVCKRIGQVLVPELYSLNPKIVGERVKSKIEWLVSSYKKHACRLRKTGEGVQADGDSETMEFYIPGDGPDESTPERALNVWNEILEQFPYFKRLHCLYSSRPNVIPIVITTGVTRTGPRTIWHQPPDNSNIDPALLAISSQPTTPAPINPATTPTSSSQLTAPLTSAQSRTPFNKSSSVVPQKRSLVEAMLEMSRENLEHLRHESQLKRIDSRRGQLLEEFKLGIWTKDEYRKKARKLAKVENGSSASQQQNLRSSPDWDSELPSSQN